jgi:hypothetical protein
MSARGRLSTGKYRRPSLSGSPVAGENAGRLKLLAPIINRNKTVLPQETFRFITQFLP